MPLIIPIQESGLFLNRYAAHFSVDVTREAEVAQAHFSADIRGAEGTIAFVDVISELLDSAR